MAVVVAAIRVKDRIKQQTINGISGISVRKKIFPIVLMASLLMQELPAFLFLTIIFVLITLAGTWMSKTSNVFFNGKKNLIHCLLQRQYRNSIRCVLAMTIQKG